MEPTDIEQTTIVRAGTVFTAKTIASVKRSFQMENVILALSALIWGGFGVGVGTDEFLVRSIILLINGRIVELSLHFSALLTLTRRFSFHVI